MVDINNPTATPDLFLKGDPQIITINWEGSIEGGDNKVDIYFSIEENCPVFFLDKDDVQQKEVYIGAYDFEVDEKTYPGATILVVTKSRTKATTAIITVTAIDKNGKGQTDSDVCTIMYK